ncbi:hypothetical protein [Hyalangium minutum]|nr:hypothetical protein [Hyalangium minutum]
MPSLPGLDLLIKTCRHHGLPLELSPPLPTAPKAGELLLAQPLDPMLAALYQRTADASLGPFSVFRLDAEPHGFIQENEYFKRDGEEPFRSTHLFAKETGFSYYFGTVPELADSTGLQPIVYIAYYPAEVYGIPIASNLDRFFALYSRYLERMAVDPEYLETGTPEITFPWEMAQQVAEDSPLVALMRAGRFTHLLNDYHGARKWVTNVLSTLM